MKITVTSANFLPTGRLVQRISDEVLSSRTIERLEQELQSLDASERSADPETRREPLERAVRRIWGALL